MVIKLEIKNVGKDRHLIGTREKGGDRIDLGVVVPLKRFIEDPMVGRPRFLKGSLMTSQ